MDNRDFKGVWIPKEIWFDENLTMLEKGIWAEIHSLDNENHCLAGNEYLATFCQCSERKVSEAIKKLCNLGYIEIVSFDGRHRIIKTLCSMQTRKICEADSQKIQSSNIENNIEDNKVLSKDNTSGFLGSISIDTKSKKPTLYQKCMAYIDMFTTDEEIKKLLKAYLDTMLEKYRDTGKTMYFNMFKSKVNELVQFEKEDWEQIIINATSGAWEHFYALKTFNQSNLHSSTRTVQSVTMTDDDYSELNRQIEQRIKDGKKVSF